MLRAGGAALTDGYHPRTPHPEERCHRCIRSGVFVRWSIVANKRLGAVLSKIRHDQQERDRQRLARRSLTNRQKDRIRNAAARADASG